MVEFLPIPKGDDTTKDLTAGPVLNADKVHEMLAVWQKPVGLGTTAATSGADIVRVDYRDSLSPSEQAEYDRMSRGQQLDQQHMNSNDHYDYRHMDSREKYQYQQQPTREQEDYLRMSPNERWEHDHPR